ncbi:MAG: hypothetical protein WCW02_03205 [Candidatus Buchananbacteria bacterium]
MKQTPAEIYDVLYTTHRKRSYDAPKIYMWPLDTLLLLGFSVYESQIYVISCGIHAMTDFGEDYFSSMGMPEEDIEKLKEICLGNVEQYLKRTHNRVLDQSHKNNLRRLIILGNWALEREIISGYRDYWGSCRFEANYAF